jgi:arabinogalactan oligomer / maltooligosaccharide transport system permease protein
VASRTSFEPLDPASSTEEDGRVTAVGDFKRLTLKEAVDVGDAEILKYVVKTDSVEIRPESLTSASESIERYRYDASKDRIVDQIDGTEFRAIAGTFTSPDGTKLFPGYRANVGWKNFTKSFQDASLREAFIRVFAWNFAFALITIFLDSALGLTLALVLNHPTMRFRRIYRSLLFLPYALPSVMMILVWSEGIFNTGYGAINRFFGIDVGWLDGQWTARLSILVVNMWLGFGYKLVLFSGQLQSIPGELKEAALVDGATGWQSFRRITLPILLTGLAPMLISSFAFNFNNGGLIEAMTKGGPPIPNSTSVAGHTDILISYTLRVAFSTGRGADYGYACALSILIFFIVGAISIVSFRATNQFKELK